MHTRKMLLAEDDDRDCELIITALKEHNIKNEIDRVSDGEELLEYLRCEGKYSDRENQLPVVILLDLKMPKISGLEALKILKSDATFKQVPIVILTSSQEDKDLKKCYELNANAYVVKPVDFHQLIEVVKGISCFWGMYNRPPYIDD